MATILIGSPAASKRAVRVSGRSSRASSLGAEHFGVTLVCADATAFCAYASIAPVTDLSLCACAGATDRSAATMAGQREERRSSVIRAAASLVIERLSLSQAAQRQ